MTPNIAARSGSASRGLDVVIHTWRGAKHICRHLRQTGLRKNKSEKNRSWSRSLSAPLPLRVRLCPSPTPLSPRLSPSFSGSCDFLPVVLTLRSVCLRVSVTPLHRPLPPITTTTTTTMLIKHNLEILVCPPPPSPTSTNNETESCGDRGREKGGLS